MSEADPIVDALGEPCGLYFKVRAVFESGFVSGAHEAVIEPVQHGLRLDYHIPRSVSYGAYFAPGIPVGILVGKEAIQQFLQRSADPVNVPAARVRKMIDTDSLGRKVIAFGYEQREGAVEIVGVEIPLLFQEGFSESRFDYARLRGKHQR